ncbi:L,D-transpeptidase family protein [Peribacillus kribbensis]|uniref:L,D-transpeptidase family protein n=1 Tax=Peribacillus kribbensis TaxID=356658 RepID=UPI00041209BD|nr:L,D-transpeptidase family protein [Peribacillus kribbensis]
MKKLTALLLGFLVFQASAHTALGAQMVIVNKAHNELAFYDQNKLVRTFKVATGRDNSLTPQGAFKIVTKIKDRPYYTGHIAGGDPRNPLGTRWLGIDANGTDGNHYAIHGNNNPASIGTYASSGCVRMLNNEIEWLFDQVSIKTPVVITYTSQTFDQIADQNGYYISTWTLLKKGSKGEAVKHLQARLTSLGYSTKGTDGIYGENTVLAVKAFQSSHHLNADGVTGSLTKKALGQL